MKQIKFLNVYLNPEELVVGAAAGFIPGGFPWLLLTVPACALLWALGGAGFAGTKLWRRIGVPVVICGAIAFIFGQKQAFAGIPLGFSVLCIGYGTPDVNDPIGSVLGRWCLSITDGNQEVAKFITRSIVILLLFVACWMPVLLFR